MESHGCPHADANTPRRMCPHVVPRDDPDDYPDDHVISFTGSGSEYVLACEPCLDAALPELVPACDACMRECEDGCGCCLGIRGTPEIRVRPSGLRFTHRDHAAGALLDSIPLAVAAHTVRSTSSWLALRENGALVELDLDRPSATQLARVDLDALDARSRAGLVTSPTGRFAAVFAARGSRGVVVDVASGATTMELDRGSYHARHCEYSVAFTRIDGRDVIIHATDWNRLDLSEPETGKLLTPRAYAPSGERETPPHYLDYFHCGLTVSPSGRWLVDDGWIWHPRGALRAVDLRRWERENPWESEDGTSVRVLRWIDYGWDLPRCFVDDRRLAVWGLGADTDHLVDGVIVFDVEDDRRLRVFAGPPDGRFFFDQHLVVAAREGGTSVWDVETGERLHVDAELCPVAHHAGAHVFLSVGEGGSLRESRLVSPS